MKEATDLGIGAAVRRELAGRRVDLGKIKFPVKAGVVTLQGELAFVGIDKTAEETAIELKFIESSLRQIAGVKELVFEIENWSKSEGGTWESSGQSQSPTSGSSAFSGAVSGDGLYCDECDMVIRFCPCCGKPLAASAKGAGRPRRTLPPVKPVIKKKLPGITPMPAGITAKKETTPMPAAGIPTPTFPKAEPVQSPPPPLAPAAPVIPAAPAAPISPAKPVEPLAPAIPPTAKPAMPVKPVSPGAKPAPAIPVKPTMPARPVESPARPVAPAPAATPAKPSAPTTAPRPAPAAKPAPAAPDRQPAAPAVTEKGREETDSMNFDNLNLGLDDESQKKPAAAPVEPAETEVPRPEFMKSENIGDDLFGSLIDNLSQSGKETSDEALEQSTAGQQYPGAGEGVPDINLDSLDSFSSPSAATNDPGLSLGDVEDLLPPAKPAPHAPTKPAPSVATTRPQSAKSAPAADELADDLADLLPPMKPETKPAAAKPASRPAPAKPAPVKEPDPFAGIEDTPLPPMKPADTAGGFEDDDTPLPPMKPKTPAGKESKDPFAALFSEADLGLGTGGAGGEGGKDPFASLDLDLDVLEVFPSDDAPAVPAAPAKPAAGGKKPAAGKPAPPADDNPFNIDNIIDLDSPVEEKPKGGKKPAKDPFDLDDFDIGKFKL